MNLARFKKIHFIGIGGIGISAVAKIFLTQQEGCLPVGRQATPCFEVSGSDLVASEMTTSLKKKGAKISIGPHQAKNLLPKTQLVIYSLAVPASNPEFKEARRRGLKMLSYPEALGELMENKFGITISGTHGKSTTTAMIGLILEAAGFDPTVVVGSKVALWDGNLRLGQSNFFVAEACEYQQAFFNYSPRIIVLTNIEPEHLDYYKNFDNLLLAFKKYLAKLPKGGILIANQDDPGVRRVIKESKGLKRIKIVGYGLKNGEVRAKNIKEGKNGTNFDLVVNRLTFSNYRLSVPGLHNVYNALASIALAIELKIHPAMVKKTLKDFRGIWRRFEIKGVYPLTKNSRGKDFGEGVKGGVTVIDDYAHHPTEIKATLAAARVKYPKSKIWCVFQPHHYYRTYALFDEFAKAFKKADRVIMSDIYEVAGREEKEWRKKVSSEKLVRAIRKNGTKAQYIVELDEIKNYLLKALKKGDVVITMGAGTITKLAGDLIKGLSR